MLQSLFTVPPAPLAPSATANTKSQSPSNIAFLLSLPQTITSTISVTITTYNSLLLLLSLLLLPQAINSTITVSFT